MSRPGSYRLTKKFRSAFKLICASRVQPRSGGLPRDIPALAASRIGTGYWMHPGLQFFSTYRNTSSSDTNIVKNAKVHAAPPSSPGFSFSNRLRWVLGSIVSLLLPVWSYWQQVQRIEGEAEEVMEGVEKVSHIVEKVASVAEKVSADVAESLPDNGKLKKVALAVERVSEEIAHDAQLTEEFIHKVEEVKNDLDDLGALVEPVIDNIINREPATARN